MFESFFLFDFSFIRLYASNHGPHQTHISFKLRTIVILFNDEIDGKMAIRHV